MAMAIARDAGFNTKNTSSTASSAAPVAGLTAADERRIRKDQRDLSRLYKQLDHLPMQSADADPNPWFGREPEDLSAIIGNTKPLF
ncbi:hypothetical protein DAERI_010066 [Deinococcus aerius]|uniref:Uncharacterized protein n=1 Tax=Deinococcus aerius TaxID=200253 RepID=A0A2I9CR15_9DEIO|nr:hypothetical protein [Deinococcus aerius]GBF03894.1 hypothetical protein DAERI_010066 [Deinococcus aerius]